MDRVVFYARTSTEEERQCRALETQVMELRELVSKTQDWELVDEYIDQSSGTTMKGRTEFNRLVQDMSNDKFDIIIIKDQDRLMRDEYTWYMFRNELLTNKKRLFIKMEGRFYIPDSDGLITGIKAIIAAQYSRDLSKKMNQAHKTRMKKGTVVTNGLIWGYDQKDGKLHINEKQAEVVRFVFNSYVSGKGFRAILRDLIDMGIKSRNGTPFSITTLKRIIRQEKYKGTLICGKRHKNFYTKNYEDVPEEDWVIHENTIPAIVSTELWEEANRIVENKVKHYNNKKSKQEIFGYFNGKYALSGKIKCGKCGKSYYHNTMNQKRADGNRYSWEQWDCGNFKLYGKKHDLGCDNPSVRNISLTNTLKDVITDILKRKDECISNIMKTLQNVLDDTVNSTGVIDSLNKEIDSINTKRSKLLDLYTDGMLDKSAWKQKDEELAYQLEFTHNQINQIQELEKQSVTKAQRLQQIEEFLKHCESIENDINDEILAELVYEIIVNPDGTFDITLNAALDKKYPSVSDCGSY